MNNFIILFFEMDIMLMVFIAYLASIISDNHKTIARIYAVGWVIFYVLSRISAELVEYFLWKPATILFGLPILRILLIIKLFSSAQKNPKFSHFRAIRLKIICGMLFVIQYVGYWHYRRRPAANYRHTRQSCLAKDLLEVIFSTFLLFFNVHVTFHIQMMLFEGIRRIQKVGEGDIEAGPNFGHKHHLHAYLEGWILAHYATDSKELQKQNPLIRQFRLEALKEVYLFKGVSIHFLSKLISEMEIQFYLPNQDVIQQNEFPTDLYITANRTVDLLMVKEKGEQVVMKADVIGEIGVLGCRSQPFTVRTLRFTKLLRLNRATFLDIVKANMRDGTMIMNNLLQHLKKSHDPIKEEGFLEIGNIIAQWRQWPAMIKVSCPKKGGVAEDPIRLPSSFGKLIEICVNKYNFIPTKVLKKNGGQVDCIDLVRDCDHLIFSSH